MAGVTTNNEEIITNGLDLFSFVLLTPQFGRFAELSIKAIVWLLFILIISILITIAFFIVTPVVVPGLSTYIAAHKDSSNLEIAKLIMTYSYQPSFSEKLTSTGYIIIAAIVITSIFQLLFHFVPHFTRHVEDIVTKSSKNAALFGISIFFITRLIALASAVGGK